VGTSLLTFVFAVVAAAARTGATGFALAVGLAATAGFALPALAAAGLALAGGLLAPTGFAAFVATLVPGVFDGGFIT
jgi:hypothetical protein